jgi:hypothetical protein
MPVSILLKNFAKRIFSPIRVFKRKNLFLYKMGFIFKSQENEKRNAT